MEGRSSVFVHYVQQISSRARSPADLTPRISPANTPDSCNQCVVRVECPKVSLSCDLSALSGISLLLLQYDQCGIPQISCLLSLVATVCVHFLETR